jgi:two-component system sensor histidine kinase/response regulator
VEKNPFDVVLMDLQMPVMDGFEATRRIRAQPRFARLPVLAMTANALAGDRERSLAAGMNDHVTKPIDPDELFDVLLRWLPDPAGRSAAAPDAAAPSAHPANAESLTGDPWRQIPGLDAADGLRRILGRREAYVGLLRRFARTQAQTVEQIRVALAEGRRPDAERAAHTLKGIAGSIGAHQLQRETGDVESALRGAAALTELETVLGPAERTLAALVSALQAALPSEAEPAPPPAADPGAVLVAVQRLMDLLAHSAMEAVDVFEASAPALTSAFGERITDVGTLVRDYCFEEALAALQDAVNRSRKDLPTR